MVCGEAEPEVGPAVRCWFWCPSTCLLASPALKLVLVSRHHGNGLKYAKGSDLTKAIPSGEAQLKGSKAGNWVSVGCRVHIAAWDAAVESSSTTLLFLWLKDALSVPHVFPAAPNSLISGTQSFRDKLLKVT